VILAAEIDGSNQNFASPSAHKPHEYAYVFLPAKRKRNDNLYVEKL